MAQIITYFPFAREMDKTIWRNVSVSECQYELMVVSRFMTRSSQEYGG